MPDINLEIQVGEKVIRASVNIPAEPVTTVDLLPILQGFSSAVVDAASEGAPITCHKGCGACCRQLVPISVTEAIYLGNLIEDMPPERKATILARFRDAATKIKSSGVLARLKPGELNNMNIQREEAMAYFYLGVPCPFLEDESCGIYEDRPLVCREYLVTSPPQYCAQPADNMVHTLTMPKKLSFILYNFGDGAGNDGVKVIPMTMMFEYGFPEPPLVPGVELFRNFVTAFTEQTL
jgi:Fe-S-cluster containining protein